MSLKIGPQIKSHHLPLHPSLHRPLPLPLPLHLHLPLVTWHQDNNPEDGGCGMACPYTSLGTGPRDTLVSC